jgi:hypothetical protein
MKNICLAFLSLSFVLISIQGTAQGTSPAASSSGKARLPKAGDFVELGDAEQSGDTDKGAEGAATKDSKEAKAALKAKDSEQVLTGTVRVLRKITSTEAFFTDLPDSYMIPSGNGYYSIYKAFTESQKKGTPVSFRVNTKSRRVLSLEDAPEKPAVSGTKTPDSSTERGSK